MIAASSRGPEKISLTAAVRTALAWVGKMDNPDQTKCTLLPSIELDLPGNNPSKSPNNTVDVSPAQKRTQTPPPQTYSWW
ncbi:MAG: hypothetical protein GF344_08790 [Chitinivibrionales bacterium]|nr:hypothetical protein [Chitinivibrionales bacterium]